MIDLYLLGVKMQLEIWPELTLRVWMRLDGEIRYNVLHIFKWELLYPLTTLPWRMQVAGKKEWQYYTFCRLLFLILFLDVNGKYVLRWCELWYLILNTIYRNFLCNVNQIMRSLRRLHAHITMILLLLFFANFTISITCHGYCFFFFFKFFHWS